MLTILTTHPIQYQVPLWQALARDGRVPFEVWYLSDHGTRISHDQEFGRPFAWDLDMLAGYPHRFLPTPPNAEPTNFWQCRVSGSLTQLFKEAGTRVVWIQGWQVAAYWQAVMAAKLAGVEVWLRGESNDLAQVSFAKGILKRALLGWLFRRIDRFLCIGSGNRRLYQKYGVGGERLLSTPYCVDNERFQEQAKALMPQRQEIRESWGISEDALCVLFCGKFIPKKRPMDLVNAAMLLRQTNPDANLHLLFAGSGELGPELRAHCDVVFDADVSTTLPMSDRPRDGLRPRASFTGFLNQTKVSKAYAAADVLVLPSDYGETWGLVINEAMASGLPCVISSRCGSAEDLGRLPPNQVFAFGDAAQLAQCLVPFLSGRRRNTADPSWLDQYSFRQVVDAVAAAYAQTIAVA